MFGKSVLLAMALAAAATAQITFTLYTDYHDYNCEGSDTVKHFPHAVANECHSFGVSAWGFTATTAPDNDAVTLFTEANCNGDAGAYHFAPTCLNSKFISADTKNESYASFRII